MSKMFNPDLNTNLHKTCKPKLKKIITAVNVKLVPLKKRRLIMGIKIYTFSITISLPTLKINHIVNKNNAH